MLKYILVNIEYNNDIYKKNNEQYYSTTIPRYFLGKLILPIHHMFAKVKVHMVIEETVW